MIVQRIIVQIKPGKLNEALEIAKGARKRWPFPGRLYSSIYGNFDQIVFDFDAENQAELDKYWEEATSSEEWGPMIAEWNKLIVPGSPNELWNLVE